MPDFERLGFRRSVQEKRHKNPPTHNESNEHVSVPLGLHNAGSVEVLAYFLRVEIKLILVSNTEQ